MIKAIAVDDEIPALKIIENFCSNTDLIDLQKTFNKPAEALKYLRKFPVDLLFLDIQMPSLNGMELYKSLEQKVMVIFTTAYSDYAVEGFSLNAVDYLLKPFTVERFTQAMEKANDFYLFQNKKEKTTQSYIFIRADYSLVKISLHDIIYIEGKDDYLKINFQNQKPIVARMTMKSMLLQLPEIQFMRIHKSYIISLKHVVNIRNKIVYMPGAEIPLGSSYEESLLRFFNT